MAQFTDNQGRVWAVEINVNTLRRLRSMLDVQLERAGDSKEDSERIIGQIFTDPIFLCDVLFVVCMDAAERGGVTDEYFGRAMAGDAIANARKALIEALVNFSHSADRREVIREGERLMEEAEAAYLKSMRENITNPKTRAKVVDRMYQLGSVFSESLEASE